MAFCFLDKCYSSGLYFGYMKMPRVGDVVYSNFHKWRMLIGGAVLMVVFSMYLTGVKMIGSVKASLVSCVEPVASMVLTAVWMKVSFTTPDLIGTLFVIATIIILAVPTKKRQK